MTSARPVRVVGLAQHEAWSRREVPPVEQLAPDLWSVPVPMPARSPLRYVSVHVFAVPGGLVLLDAGWGSDEAWDALVAGLATFGATPADVRGVLVTHMHFDHLGLAGRVREASGAWIALHEADHAIIARPDHRDAELAVAGEALFLRSLGAGADEAARVVGPAERFAPFAGMALPDRHLAHGELADVPGWTLRAVHTPGHTPGHVCLVDERSSRLFAGDHVLPRITPNVSAERGDAGAPLGDYLRSLRAVADLDVELVLPAHEWRFEGLAARVEAILAHHEHRLAELLDAVRAHPGATPWELAGQITWSRPWDQYDGRMRVFAVTETAAHVFELAARGAVRGRSDLVRVEGRPAAEVVRYTATSPG